MAEDGLPPLGAADRNRTGATCLEGRGSAIELQRHGCRACCHTRQKKEKKQMIRGFPRGATGRTRTPDLLITNQLLYQLSYDSMERVCLLINKLHG